MRSSTAYQQYWTGIVRARDVLGKFTFVPLDPASPSAEGHGPQRFTHDWQARQRAGDLRFELRWMPFIDERETPTEDLTRGWSADQASKDRLTVEGWDAQPVDGSVRRDERRGAGVTDEAVRLDRWEVMTRAVGRHGVSRMPSAMP